MCDIGATQGITDRCQCIMLGKLRVSCVVGRARETDGGQEIESERKRERRKREESRERRREERREMSDRSRTEGESGVDSEGGKVGTRCLVGYATCNGRARKNVMAVVMVMTRGGTGGEAA